MLLETVESSHSSPESKQWIAMDHSMQLRCIQHDFGAFTTTTRAVVSSMRIVKAIRDHRCPKFTNWTPALIFSGQKSETISKSTTNHSCWILYPPLLSHMTLRQLTLPFVITTYKANQIAERCLKSQGPRLYGCATRKNIPWVSTSMENVNICQVQHACFSYPSLIILFLLSIRLKHPNTDTVSSEVGVELWPACRPHCCHLRQLSLPCCALRHNTA